MAIPLANWADEAIYTLHILNAGWSLKKPMFAGCRLVFEPTFAGQTNMFAEKATCLAG